MTDRLLHALDRAGAVCEALAHGQRTFGDLRAASVLPGSTLARLLKAMLAAGLVAAHPDGYRLGARALCQAYLIARAAGPAELLAPTLAELAASTGDAAAYFAWRDGRLTLVAVHELPEAFKYMAIGGTVPELSRHGFARTVVALLPPAEQRAAWAACPRRGEIAFSGFLAATRACRRDGVAIERGEHNPVCWRVCAPVLAGDGAPLGAIGVSSLRRDLRHARAVAPLVKAAAAAANRLLDHSGASA